MEEQYGEDEENLFMPQDIIDDRQKHIWFVDGGCLNHVTEFKSTFSDLDEIDKHTIKLSNGVIFMLKKEV